MEQHKKKEYKDLFKFILGVLIGSSVGILLGRLVNGYIMFIGGQVGCLAAIYIMHKKTNIDVNWS